jgi:DNA ligase-1
MTFKPMKGDPVDFTQLTFPKLVSPKIDGVRAVITKGAVLSSKLKPLPNKWLQSIFAHKQYDGLDGELAVGDPFDPLLLRKTKSHVMSIDKAEYDVRLFAFDHITNFDLPYHLRRPKNNPRERVVLIPQHDVSSMEELLHIEQTYLDAGYEGVMLRDPFGPYKYGRSTVKEGYLLKLKRFEDAEFKVLDFVEREHNGNEATINELGRTKRSSAKAGKTGRGDLGALVLENPFGPGTFNVGTGFTDEQRAEIWSNRKKYLGSMVKVKYFTKGMTDTPLLPTLLGWRSKFE